MKIKITNILLVFFVFVLTACGGGIVKDIPFKPNTNGKYIFYLHGSVEESEGLTEKYQMAISAISASSATVVSEVRGDTNPNSYAVKLKEQVEVLISKGVPARNITLSGYSKGSIIVLAASSVINNPSINYVLLAGCSEVLNEKYNVNAEKAVGRILSIYDSGDDKFESCEGTIITSTNVMFKEIDLDSGKGHKVFRIPKEKFIELWRDPLIDWAGV